jgi:membrane protein implicated in regulation of membrane protease activity
MEVAAMPDLTEYLWIIWLVFIFVCVIIELITLEFTFLMVAVGSLGGLAANLLGLEWWLQILIAAVLSTLLLFTIRPLLLRTLTRGADTRPTNVAALMGLTGTTLSALTDAGGLAKLSNGETWTARLDESARGADLLAGEKVIVTAIEGSTAVVVPAVRKVE